MTGTTPNPDREELLARLRSIETDLSLREQDLKTLRRRIRDLESEVWRVPAAAPVPVASPAKPSQPPPLPVDAPAAPSAPREEGQPLETIARVAGETAPQPVPAAPAEPAAPLAQDAGEDASPKVTPPSAPFAPPSPQAKGNLEQRIGAVWFNRIGLGALIVGFALLSRLIAPALQPWHKVAAMYLVSAALFTLGLVFDRRFRVFARPVAAGALALAFFAAYAAHFISATACLPLGASLALMLLSTLGILALAEGWKSEPTAALAVFFGHAAAYVGGADTGTVPLVAILLLTLTAAALFVRHDWRPLSLLAVVAAFGSHFLWAAQTGAGDSVRAWFWMNFTFLTAYYVTFLLADLLLQSRRPEARPAAAGPAAMVLYSVSTIWLFHVTALYWDRLHVFLLAFAAVQAVLAGRHLLRRDASLPVYSVAAVLFATLGFFAWIDGLTLTLTLAAEGLVVMTLARRRGLGFLHPIAQLVLAAAFFQYWAWGGPSDTWAALAANLAAALAFLGAAALEERWPPRAADSTGDAADRTFGFHPRYAAAPHAVAAGLIAATQLAFSFSGAAASLALGCGVLAVLATALPARIRCAGWTVWVIQGLLMLRIFAFAVGGIDGAGIAPQSVWAVHQAVCVAMVCAGAAVLRLGFAGCRPHRVVTGAGMLLLAAATCVFANATGEPSGVLWPVVIFVPAVYLLFGAVGQRRGDAWDARDRAWYAARLPADPRVLRVLLACIGVLLLHLAAWSVYPMDPAALLLAGGLIAVLATLIFCKAAPLNAPVILHGALLAAVVAVSDRAEALTSGALGAVFGSFAAGAVLLAFIGRPGDRIVRAWPAHGLQFCFLVGLFIALARELAVGTPLYLWGVLAVAVWAAADRLDRDGQGGLRGIGLVEALSAALVFPYLLRAGGAEGIALGWALAVSALALGAAAGALRSAPFTGAFAAVLAGAFVVLLFDLGLPVAVREHPGFPVALVLLCLAAGGVAEAVRRRLREAERAPAWRTGLSWLGIPLYAAGIVLALAAIDVAVDQRAAPFLPFPAPIQVAFATVLFLAGVRLRLHRLAGLALAATGAALIFSVPDLLTESFGAALIGWSVCIALLLVLTERTLGRDACAFIDEAAAGLRPVLRVAAVIAAALQMVAAFLFTSGTAGYLTTLGWSVTALVLMVAGFAWNDRAYRYTALGLFLLSIMRAVFVDIAGLGTVYRVAAFMCLGASLLLVSFLYARFQDRIRRWL